MTITRGLAAAGIARVVAGALGALVVALVWVPAPAQAWQVSTTGGVLTVVRESSDPSMSVSVPAVAYCGSGGFSGLNWDQEVSQADGPSQSLELTGLMQSQFVLYDYPSVALDIDGVHYSLVNPAWSGRDRVIHVKVDNDVNVLLAGVVDRDYRQMYFGDGIDLSSYLGTVTVAGAVSASASDPATVSVSVVNTASVEGTVAVSNFPTSTAVSNFPTSTTDSSSSVAASVAPFPGSMVVSPDDATSRYLVALLVAVGLVACAGGAYVARTMLRG